MTSRLCAIWPNKWFTIKFGLPNSSQVGIIITMRLFVAINLSDAQRAAVYSAIPVPELDRRGLKRVDDRNLHITVRFSRKMR